MGIPTDVAVRLAVDTVAGTVMESVFEAATGTFFAFLCSGINGSAVTGKGKGHEVNEPVLNGMGKKKYLKDLIELPAGFHVMRWFQFELFKEIFNRSFFNRGSFFSFFIGSFRLLLRRVDRIRKILMIGEPKPFLKIIKSTGTGSVTDSKAGKDGVKLIFFEVSSQSV